ncbi:MAG TPA: DNA topoisomerase, partial [Bacillota bacterium]|nr:DNA topoisomerase [Bacillota bacterium]
AAEVDTVSMDILCNHSIFRTTGETIRFQGFLAAYADMTEDATDDEKAASKAKLPQLEFNQLLHLLSMTPEQKFTLPPPRYTEATLIKALEEKGIGRPSTYAPTISTILARNYVAKESKYLAPTELGDIVTDMLSNHFQEIVDVSFTAEMEEQLDEIELGKKNWVKVLGDFYPDFHELIVKASSDVQKVEMKTENTGEKCPDCEDGELLIKEGRYGKFIACSNFPTCKFTKNIEIKANGKCPLCGSGLVSHTSRKYKGRVFYTCDKKGSDADCKFISWDLPVEDKLCETCNSYMVWKRFRGRTYPKCSNKDCPTNARKTKSKDEDIDKEERVES